MMSFDSLPRHPLVRAVFMFIWIGTAWTGFFAFSGVGWWSLVIGPGGGLVAVVLMYRYTKWFLPEDAREANRCEQCGHDLAGLPASSSTCPECGLARDRCDRCGYDLAGLPTSSTCPECGLARPR
ncbi:MAG TPA: hypothetical protein VHC70_08990 [Phycisphaerales bacterium]|nr:hypothetical protein [Phycisphaerales bacterium]